MRIGLFGGSFDPVHYGHLILAELAREARALDEVRFVPAAIPPHKQDRNRASGEHRVEMLKLGIGGNDHLDVWDGELQRGGVSYTVETLRELTAAQPNDDFYFLLGADSIFDLPNWREPAEICRLATIVAVNRPGSPPVDFNQLDGLVSAERLQQFQESVVDMPLVEISSTDLRHRIATKQSIRYQTPRAVEAYIRSHELYRT